MIKVKHSSPLTWTADVDNEDSWASSGRLTLSMEDDRVDLLLIDQDDDASCVSFCEPYDLRRVAYQMIEEAANLETRIDVAEGMGGDQ